MRIHVQPAIQVDDQDRIHCLVAPAVFGFLNRVAKVDPDAVPHAVVVGIHFPRTDDRPRRDHDRPARNQVVGNARIERRNRRRTSPNRPSRTSRSLAAIPEDSRRLLRLVGALGGFASRDLLLALVRRGRTLPDEVRPRVSA